MDSSKGYLPGITKKLQSPGAKHVTIVPEQNAQRFGQKGQVLFTAAFTQNHQSPCKTAN